VSRPIPDKSIAVLPFTDMSEKHDQEYFADGMAEEIINLLAQVPNLRVPGRTSSFYFKGKSTKIPDIARELGVAHVLEGSVRQSGNRLRVTAQLIRADNGYHLWSETFDRNLHDVFETQDDIANAVVQALQITLMGGSLTRQKGGTKNLDAYQLFLRALSDYSLNSKSALGSAHEHLDQAIKLDPNFALASADLGWVVVLQSQHSVLPQKEAAEHARQLARRALQLSPELAEAHALLQYIHRTYDWDWASCEVEGREALRIDPSNVHALVTAGKLARTLGHWDDAERYANAALARDPFYTYAIWDLGRARYGAGRFADAEASYRKLLALAPDFGGARSHLVTTLLLEGRSGAALAMAQQDSDEEERLTVLPIALQSSNRKGEADEALHTLIAKFGNSHAYSVARIYAFRGEGDLAFEWLDRAYQQRDAYLLEFVGEHLFANVANDVRYKAFLRKMNLPE
jgi:TolB-like protein/Tfp pilus assembly protein PilF